MPGFDPYGPKNWQKTKPKKQTPLRELFGAHFSETLNPEHPLYVLAERIDWQQSNITIDACYAEELGRCRLQSSKAAALDRFFSRFGTVAVAGGGAALQIAPQAASAEPLTDKSKFTQIAIEQSAGGFSGTTIYGPLDRMEELDSRRSRTRGNQAHLDAQTQYDEYLARLPKEDIAPADSDIR